MARRILFALLRSRDVRRARGRPQEPRVHVRAAPSSAGGRPTAARRSTRAALRADRIPRNPARRAHAVAEGGLNDLRLFDRPAGRCHTSWCRGSGARSGATVGAACRSDQDHERLRGGLRGRQAIDRVRVAGIPAPFLKRLTLEGSGDRARWTLLQGEGTLFDLPDERISNHELAFTPGAYRYVRVTWNDSEQRPRTPAGARRRARREWRGVQESWRDLDRLPFERRPSEPGRSRYRVTLPGGASADRRADPRRCTWPRVSCRVRVRVPLRRHRGGACRSGQRHARAGASCGRVRRVAARQDCAARGSGARSDRRGRKQSAARSAQGVRRVRRAPLDLFRGGLVQPSWRDTAIRRAAPTYDLEAARASIDLARTPRVDGTLRTRWPVRSAPSGRAPAISAGATLEGEFRYSRTIAAAPMPGSPRSRSMPQLWVTARGPRRGSPTSASRTERTSRSRICSSDAASRLAVDLDARHGLVSDAAASAGEWGQPVGVSHCAAGTPTAGGVAERRDQRACVPTLGPGWRRSRPADRRRREARFDALTSTTWRHAEERASRSGAPLWMRSGGCDGPVAGRRRRRQRAATTQPRATAAAVLSTAILCAAGGALRLLYGREDLQPPRYDLSLLAPKLMGAPATEVKAGPESSRADAAPFISPRWFWALLGAAVMVLLGLIVRLAKRA